MNLLALPTHVSYPDFTYFMVYFEHIFEHSIHIAQGNSILHAYYR